jgi:eukaryotic-like serine/threonine-protein kinase
MDAFDAALDQPSEQRTAWLEQAFADQPDVVAAVQKLIAADTAPTILPGQIDLTAELIPPERVGVYKLVGPVGGGGMGEVWLAERDDGLFEHRVAIKLMRPSLYSPELEDFFDRERRLLARMRHPNIARLFDGGVSVEGVPWFAMDLIEGVPLDVWADTTPSLGSARRDVAERVRVACSICAAVHHAHRNLIVHADLKPPNILVDTSIEPRLVDFGIADLVAAADDPALTRRYPNTPTYASPERLQGAGPSIPDDIFALGTVLHGLLSGRWIEKGERALPKPSAHAPDPNRGGVLLGDLDAIVERARAADPAQRYPSAEALEEDLRAWLEQRPVAARQGGWRYHAGRFVRRHKALSATLVVALMLLIATTIAITTLYFRAERALAAAEQRFAEVRGLARYMLVDLYDALEPLAGASALRVRTADVARSYLERLSALATDDVDLSKDLAIGYGRVGRAYALTSTNGSFGFQRGERALIRGEELLTPLVEAHPDRADLKVELARILTWHSQVAAFAHSDAAAAHRMLDRALALAEEAQAASPLNIDAGYARWQAVLGRLDVLGSQRRGADEVALAADQLQRATQLPTPSGYAVLRPLMEAAAENAWGDGLYYQDKKREALAHYERAYRVLEPIRARASADVRVRTRMILYAYGTSSVLNELGNRRAALDWAQRAIEEARALQQFEVSPTVNQAVSLATLQYATLLVEAGRGDQAIAEARAVVERRRAMVDADPGSDDARSGYLFLLKTYREVLALAGRTGEACVVAREASQGWADLYRGRAMPAAQAGDARAMAEAAARCPPPRAGG